VGAQLFHEDRGTDRQTHMKKVIVTFPSLVNVHNDRE